MLGEGKKNTKKKKLKRVLDINLKIALGCWEENKWVDCLVVEFTDKQTKRTQRK